VSGRAALYLRVSTSDQHIENQLQPLQDFCKQRGFEIVRVYAENESAWQAGHQKEWARLMHDAESRRFNTVVVWALDRITREGVSSIFMKIQTLQRYSVTVISIQESWREGLGEMSDLFVAMLAWVANFESRRRSQRTLAGLARVKLQGKKLGRPAGSKDKVRRKRGGYFNRYLDKV
jgi:putative DNA-invertase from lambdoid prophage Rac